MPVSTKSLLIFALSTLFVGVVAADCEPVITHFVVWDGDTNAPVPGDNIIDQDNAEVCMPSSGNINIEAAASWCTFEADVSITRPNGHVAGRTEYVYPFFLFGNLKADVLGRNNFSSGKDYVIAASGDGGVGGLSYTFRFKDCPIDQYNMYLDLFDVPSSDILYFTEAQAKWERVLAEGTPEVAGADLAAAPPVFEQCAYPEIIDDVYICAGYAPQDGVGGILGFAGTHWYWNSGQVLTGYMLFDSEDADYYGEWMANIVKHEMGHVMGIGTLWEVNGIVSPEAENCTYSGDLSNSAYAEISGCPVVPIEQGGGPGTRCGHWSEDCLVNELMTGYLSGADQPMSAITVNSLADMGYVVDLSEAEPFGPADLGVCPPCDDRRRELQHGETRNLRLSATKHSLSGVTEAVAMEAGRKFLESQTKLTDAATPEGMSFAGSNYVSVVFADPGGQVHSVVVTND